MRYGVERRLAVVAACVTAAGIAALPFAGGWGSSMELVTAGATPTTLPTPPTTAPAPAPPPVALPAAVPTPVEPPPVDTSPTAIAAGISSPVTVDPGSGMFAPPPSAPSAATLAAPSNPAAADEIWAVVVGVDDYPGDSHDLNQAVADADNVTASLLGNGVPTSQVLLLRDREVTSDSLIAAADWLTDNAGPSDTAIFFFAGHVRDVGDGTQVAVTSEGGWVADWLLANRFAGLRTRDAWMVIAACFGGGFDELLAPGRVLTAAASPNQLAYESGDFGLSFMVEYLFERAVRRHLAPENTVQSAVGYAMSRLAEEYPDQQIWSVDRSDHPISLGVDGPPIEDPPTDQPAAPPTTEPPAPPPERCLIVLRCG